MDPTIIIITAATLYIIYRFAIKSGANQKHSNKKKSFTPTIKVDLSKAYFAWPETGFFDFDIVGESNYQTHLMNLQSKYEGESIDAYLIPEDNNPFDTKAVRVDIDGQTVGYFDKESARDFRDKLKDKNLTNQITKCKAIITGGNQAGGKKSLHCGVRLDLELFEEEEEE